jgi:hypothetical protein
MIGETKIKCSSVLTNKHGVNVRCNAFLATIDEYRIMVICRKCGARHIITLLPDGKWRDTIYKKERKILKPSEEGNGE